MVQKWGRYLHFPVWKYLPLVHTVLTCSQFSKESQLNILRCKNRDNSIIFDWKNVLRAPLWIEYVILCVLKWTVIWNHVYLIVGLKNYLNKRLPQSNKISTYRSIYAIQGRIYFLFLFFSQQTYSESQKTLE